MNTPRENATEHAYDQAWNHTRWVHDGVEHLYLNNALNQTTQEVVRVLHEDSDGSLVPGDSAVTNKLIWSAQGGLQRDGRFIYAFDAEDQLVSVTSAALTNGAIRVVNAYDYRHRRIAKTVYRCVVHQVQVPAGSPPSPASTTLWNVKERHDFVYDDWNLIHETVTSIDANSTTNVTEIEYFWGPDLSNTLQGAGGVGGLLAVSMNGAFYFPVYDNLGNVVKYIDESGTIVASYTYDDFGQMIKKTGPMVSSFRPRFSTKYYEEETGLYYYGYRFYSPLLKIWLNFDPMGIEGGVNLYSFSGNVVLSGVDYLGLYLKLVQDHMIENELNRSRHGRNNNSQYVLKELGRYREAYNSFKPSFDKAVGNLVKCCHKSSLNNHKVCKLILGTILIPVMYQMNPQKIPHPEYGNGIGGARISKKPEIYGIILSGFYDSGSGLPVPIFNYYDRKVKKHREPLEALLFHELTHYTQLVAPKDTSGMADYDDEKDFETWGSWEEKEAVKQENLLRCECSEFLGSVLRGSYKKPKNAK